MLKKIVLTSCSLLFATNVFATTTVIYDSSTHFNTTALTGFQTDGNDMAGMKVTATFMDGSTQTALWADTGGTSGAASGANFTLALDGDTFSAPWVLTATDSIKSLFIDAGAGDTVFDVITNDEYSPGSANGYPFTALSGTSDWLDMTATYSGAVNVANVWYEDLYRYLNISFDNAGGFTANSALNYRADTDNLQIAGDITPAVPEPATILLLGGGLAGLVIWRRKKSH